MVQKVEQRKYIQDFLDFVSTFLLAEEATIDEVMLVKANIEILSKRIQEFCRQTKIGGKSGVIA